jgi:hypothetical protein
MATVQKCIDAKDDHRFSFGRRLKIWEVFFKK